MIQSSLWSQNWNIEKNGWIFQDLPIRGNTSVYQISTAWHVCIHFGFRTPAKDYWQNCIQTERIEFITAPFRSKDPAIRWTACNGRSEGFEVLIRSTSLTRNWAHKVSQSYRKNKLSPFGLIVMILWLTAEMKCRDFHNAVFIYYRRFIFHFIHFRVKGSTLFRSVQIDSGYHGPKSLAKNFKIADRTERQRRYKADGWKKDSDSQRPFIFIRTKWYGPYLFRQLFRFQFVPYGSKFQHMLSIFDETLSKPCDCLEYCFSRQQLKSKVKSIMRIFNHLKWNHS